MKASTLSFVCWFIIRHQELINTHISFDYFLVRLVVCWGGGEVALARQGISEYRHTRQEI
jgi:hypothetical protein